MAHKSDILLFYLLPYYSPQKTKHNISILYFLSGSLTSYSRLFIYRSFPKYCSFSAGMISKISSIVQFNARHILTNTSKETFSSFAIFAMVLVPIPVNSQIFFFFILRSINILKNLLLNFPTSKSGVNT